MTIVEKIKHSIEDATGLPVLYQSVEQLNRIADNADYPCAFFFLLQEQRLNTDSDNIRERVQIAVFFVEQSVFDFDAVENEEIIQRCKERAITWIRALRTDDFIRLISQNATERVYDYFDAQLTGFAVNVTIEELVGNRGCDIGDWEFLEVTPDGQNYGVLEIQTTAGGMWRKVQARE